MNDTPYAPAIAMLEISANICETNAPIHEADGEAEEAENCRSNAASYRAAIAALMGQGSLRLRAERKFAGWFREVRSGMSYRLWEQMGPDPEPGDVALYE